MNRVRFRLLRLFLFVLAIDLAAQNAAPEEIIDHYPSLQIEDIRAAIACAAELARENIGKVSAS